VDRLNTINSSKRANSQVEIWRLIKTATIKIRSHKSSGHVLFQLRRNSWCYNVSNALKLTEIAILKFWKI